MVFDKEKEIIKVGNNEKCQVKRTEMKLEGRYKLYIKSKFSKYLTI